MRYTLVAVRRDGERPAFDVVLVNPSTGRRQTHRWDPSAAREGSDLLETLAKVRQQTWQPYLRTGPAPVLRSWSALTRGEVPRESRQSRPGDNLSMFALLGGRAAVEETLQMQVLRPSDRSTAAETVEVDSIKGVQVKAHPTRSCWPVSRVANWNWRKRYRTIGSSCTWLGRMPSCRSLDQGAGFLATSGAMLSGNRLDYGLTQRYLQRLGVDRAQLEAVLRSGMVQDLAVVLPDLFLIDGTEMTVVARLNQPQLVSGLLKLLGAGQVLDTPMLAIETADGRPAHWALRGELLCLSTSRAELEYVLQQIDDQGKNSLGRSAEFRYMLTQLPVTDQTRVYAYFSDPFVRRLVGPQVKLSQARRTRTRAQMEYLTAQALRARLDGVSPPRCKQLRQMGYLPARVPIDGYSLTPQGQLHSDVYGSLARINTLPEVPLDRVTPAEAEAYDRYVDEYSRYWREFFDPIAVRLSDTTRGTLELSTFILPLVDSSVYNRLREAICMPRTSDR